MSRATLCCHLTDQELKTYARITHVPTTRITQGKGVSNHPILTNLRQRLFRLAYRTASQAVEAQTGRNCVLDIGSSGFMIQFADQTVRDIPSPPIFGINPGKGADPGVPGANSCTCTLGEMLNGRGCASHRIITSQGRKRLQCKINRMWFNVVYFIGSHVAYYLPQTEVEKLVRLMPRQRTVGSFIFHDQATSYSQNGKSDLCRTENFIQLRTPDATYLHPMPRWCNERCGRNFILHRSKFSSGEMIPMGLYTVKKAKAPAAYKFTLTHGKTMAQVVQGQFQVLNKPVLSIAHGLADTRDTLKADTQFHVRVMHSISGALNADDRNSVADGAQTYDILHETREEQYRRNVDPLLKIIQTQHGWLEKMCVSLLLKLPLATRTKRNILHRQANSPDPIMSWTRLFGVLLVLYAGFKCRDLVWDLRFPLGSGQGAPNVGGDATQLLPTTLCSLVEPAYYSSTIQACQKALIWAKTLGAKGIQQLRNLYKAIKILPYLKIAYVWSRRKMASAKTLVSRRVPQLTRKIKDFAVSTGTRTTQGCSTVSRCVRTKLTNSLPSRSSTQRTFKRGAAVVAKARKSVTRAVTRVWSRAAFQNPFTASYIVGGVGYVRQAVHGAVQRGVAVARGAIGNATPLTNLQIMDRCLPPLTSWLLACVAALILKPSALPAMFTVPILLQLHNTQHMIYKKYPWAGMRVKERWIAIFVAPILEECGKRWMYLIPGYLRRYKSSVTSMSGASGYQNVADIQDQCLPIIGIFFTTVEGPANGILHAILAQLPLWQAVLAHSMYNCLVLLFGGIVPGASVPIPATPTTLCSLRRKVTFGFGAFVSLALAIAYAYAEPTPFTLMESLRAFHAGAVVPTPVEPGMEPLVREDGRPLYTINTRMVVPITDMSVRKGTRLTYRYPKSKAKPTKVSLNSVVFFSTTGTYANDYVSVLRAIVKRTLKPIDDLNRSEYYRIMMDHHRPETVFVQQLGGIKPWKTWQQYFNRATRGTKKNRIDMEVLEDMLAVHFDVAMDDRSLRRDAAGSLFLKRELHAQKKQKPRAIIAQSKNSVQIFGQLFGLSLEERLKDMTCFNYPHGNQLMFAEQLIALIEAREYYKEPKHVDPAEVKTLPDAKLEVCERLYIDLSKFSGPKRRAPSTAGSGAKYKLDPRVIENVTAAEELIFHPDYDYYVGDGSEYESRVDIGATLTMFCILQHIGYPTELLRKDVACEGLSWSYYAAFHRMWESQDYSGLDKLVADLEDEQGYTIKTNSPIRVKGVIGPMRSGRWLTGSGNTIRTYLTLTSVARLMGIVAFFSIKSDDVVARVPKGTDMKEFSRILRQKFGMVFDFTQCSTPYHIITCSSRLNQVDLELGNGEVIPCHVMSPDPCRLFMRFGYKPDGAQLPEGSSRKDKVCRDSYLMATLSGMRMFRTTPFVDMFYRTLRAQVTKITGCEELEVFHDDAMTTYVKVRGSRIYLSKRRHGSEEIPGLQATARGRQTYMEVSGISQDEYDDVMDFLARIKLRSVVYHPVIQRTAARFMNLGVMQYDLPFCNT